MSKLSQRYWLWLGCDVLATLFLCCTLLLRHYLPPHLRPCDPAAALHALKPAAQCTYSSSGSC